MILVGFDPGLANFGWSVCASDGARLRLEELGVLTTEKDKRKVLEHEDLVRRLIRLNNHLVPLGHVAHVLCIEALSHPRNASSGAKVAATWGLIVALDRPILQRSAQEVKLAVCGNRFASKAAIEAELTRRFPNAPHMLKDVPKSRWEHPFDALAVVVACLDDPLIQALSQQRKVEDEKPL